MAPLMGEQNGNGSYKEPQLQPRIAIIGAGSRGDVYARCTTESGLGKVVAVVEPIVFKRNLLGRRYIWGDSRPDHDLAYADVETFISIVKERQYDRAVGKRSDSYVDAVFVCVRDELHVRMITALAPLGLHLMCEKPLATTLQGCLQIQRAFEGYDPKIFAIGHVLRYSPHNMTLRDLVLNQRAIGDVVSIEHTEPVGWWHSSHSYVRGNWRRESVTAPSLLTKSCHDIDWILWMLCSPLAISGLPPHLPSTISSIGSLKQFKKSRKPKEAGDATNCLSCPLVDTCMYSAKRIYYDRHLAKGDAEWPVHIVNPEIETILATRGEVNARETLMQTLAEDYDASKVPIEDIESRSWFGRCVWESDNDVCDDQHVLIEWQDDEHSRVAKSASFHMIAPTQSICERRGRIYGTAGEIVYDSEEITIHNFDSDTSRVVRPGVPENSHHGGGDSGLTEQFLKAVAAVQKGVKTVAEAQIEFLGVTIEEAVRSHAAVFAAEDARRQKRVVDWAEWWEQNVEGLSTSEDSKVRHGHR